MSLAPLVLAVAVFSAAPAEPEGEEPAADPSAIEEPVEPAVEPEDPVALAAQAEQAFAEGRYEAVVELAGRAHALTGDPRHLYAQALAQRRLERCREALILYARVLAKVEDDPAYVALVEGTRQGIRLCEEQLEPSRVEPEPKPDPVPPTSDEPTPSGPASEDLPKTPPRARPWYRDPIGGVLLSVGLVVVGGGGGATWALSSRELRTANRATDETIYASAHSSAKNLRTGAIVSFALGGALVAGAVVRYVLVDREYRRQNAGVGLVPGGGVAVHWRRSF